MSDVQTNRQVQIQQRRIEEIRARTYSHVTRPYEGGFPWDKLLSGYRIAGTSVRIYAGEIQFGTKAVPLAEKDFTIAASPTYIHARMTIQSRLGEHTAETEIKRPGDTYFYLWLYEFSLVGTIVRLEHINSRILIPGLFAPPPDA